MIYYTRPEKRYFFKEKRQLLESNTSILWCSKIIFVDVSLCDNRILCVCRKVFSISSNTDDEADFKPRE